MQLYSYKIKCQPILAKIYLGLYVFWLTLSTFIQPSQSFFFFLLQFIECRFVNSFIKVHVYSEFYFVFRLLFVKHLLTNFNSLSFKISFDSMPIYNSAYSMLRISISLSFIFYFHLKIDSWRSHPPRQLFRSFKIKFTEIIDINIRLKIWELSPPPPFFPTHLHTTNLDFKNCQLWGVFFYFVLVKISD